MSDCASIGRMLSRYCYNTLSLDTSTSWISLVCQPYIFVSAKTWASHSPAFVAPLHQYEHMHRRSHTHILTRNHWNRSFLRSIDLKALSHYEVQSTILYQTFQWPQAPTPPSAISRKLSLQVTPKSLGWQESPNHSTLEQSWRISWRSSKYHREAPMKCFNIGSVAFRMLLRSIATTASQCRVPLKVDRILGCWYFKLGRQGC